MTGLPTTQAVAGIANSFPPERWDALRLVMQNRPEASPRLMNALHHLFAKRGHGLAKLYNAVEMADVQRFPTAQQLQHDLIDTFNINNVSNSNLLRQALENFCNQFIQAPLDNIPPDQLNKLVTISTALVKAISNPLMNCMEECFFYYSESESGLWASESSPFHKLQQLYSHAQRLDVNQILEVKHAKSLIDIFMDLEHGFETFQALDDDCKNNPDFLKAVVSTYGSFLELLSDDYKNNREIVTLAVQQNGNALAHASAPLKDNIDIVIEALKQDVFALIRISDRLKTDRNFAIKAVEINGYALAFLDRTFQQNTEIVTGAVKNKGLILQCVHSTLRGNINIVTAAVQNDGLALKYVSDDLKDDPNIVAMAVRQNPAAFKHAGENCKNNPEIALEAVKQAPELIEYAGPVATKVINAINIINKTPDVAALSDAIERINNAPRWSASPQNN